MSVQPVSFDSTAFDAELAKTDQPHQLFRDALADANNQQDTQFRDGVSITALVVYRSQFIDQLLIKAWRYQMGEYATSLALVAVGGYGRGELHPHSDIDLMLLIRDKISKGITERLEQFLLFLWDIGLEIGHSVRTIADCIEQGRTDITVATNLMESRLLGGDMELYRSMRKQTDQEHIWPGRDFFEAKWQEQIQRHHKFNDTAYNLEPNIKEGPGGLRDIQMIGWVAKRHYGAENLDDLVSHGFLTEEEFQALDRGQAFLWKIRYGLHMLTGRREDRLQFDHQRTLAKLFGYQDYDSKLAVEHFMKEYYRTVMELERLNEMLLQLFQERILYAEDPALPQPINSRFQSSRGFIEVVSPDIFKHYPFALLELFLVMAQTPSLKGVRAETIRLVRAHNHLIDETFRDDIRNRTLFIELLKQPRGVTHELHRMNRYGVLATYIPQFGHVVGQMQHDLFHVYTVDEHTLRVIRNLRRFTVEKHRHEYPLCSAIAETIPKPELIYIAGLFHDIAKGRSGDHSRLGAIDAESFCRKHDLSDYDTELVRWLVRNHLSMSTTAQRKDISDPDVINEFASLMKDQVHLNYLYLLTVADIRGTSPTVWNSWKDSLLAELYNNTSDALRRGLANPIEQEESIAACKADADKLLQAQGIAADDASIFWNRVDESYFLRYSADEVAWQTGAIVAHGNNPESLVEFHQHAEGGGTEIFIHTPIKGFQFSTTTAALDRLGLNIVDARIIPTRDNYTLDTYVVLEKDGEPISGTFRIDEISATLREELQKEKPPVCTPRQMTRQLKHFVIPTRVRIIDDKKSNRTIVEVTATDRPGMLSRIASALECSNVQLHSAKIATLGDKVEDTFSITGSDGQRITDHGVLNELSQSICDSLDSDEENKDSYSNGPDQNSFW